MSEFNYSCPACGQSNVSETALAGMEITCPHCHASIIVPEAPVVVPEETTAPEATAETAAVSPQLETPPPFTGYDAGTAPPRTSGLAIASLVCSLASLVTCVGWLPGIICGHMARSRMRRDSSLKGRGLAKAGLVIGYSILMLEVAAAAVQVWVVSSAVKKAAMIAKQELATNTIVVTQTQTTPAAAVNPPSERAATGWASDISTVPFPSQPVTGKLHGMDFILKTAAIHAANLRLTSENGLELEILGLDQPVEGQNYQIQPTDAGANPQVKVTWSTGGVVQSMTFTKGYGLKLQFGPAKNRRVSGNIYLCLPDDSKSWFAGIFELRLPKAAAKPKAS
jgi:DNA-directed RNA polymerase subunit RPC12/RpoP